MRHLLRITGFLMAAKCMCCQSPPYVTCDKAPSMVRSETVSGRGRQAYAVTETRAHPQWGCANTNRLYVRTRGRAFQQVFKMTARHASDSADSLLPVGWSRGGRSLAIEALYATHLPSDAAGYGLLIYDARTGRTKAIHSDFSAAVSATEHRTCEVVLRSVNGFDGSGSVVLTLADLFDEEGNAKHCSGESARWLFDP